MKTSRLEPGLLAIFRLFAAAQLVLMLVNLHVHSARGYLGNNAGLAFPFLAGGTLALLLYLSLPWSALREARLYLPVALVYSTVFSLLAQYMFLTSPTGGGSEESAWQLFLFLCVPLVLVSWQYGFKSVVLYCVFTTLLDMLLVRMTKTDFAQFEQTYHRLVFIRFISFLMVGYIIARIMQQLRRERQALQDANQKLAGHLVTLEQLTVSRERNRVARELHDTLAHTLSGIALQLEAANSLWSSNGDQAHALLQRSLRVARDGLTETRRAIQALRATPLEDLGLANALREWAQAAADRTSFQLTLELPDRLDALPVEVEQCYYRIGQEAIENIARHAMAKSVRIHLSRNAADLCMEIADDGIGFDPRAAQAARHFGLQGMQERARLIHPDLEISSQPASGTQLRLSWHGGSK